MPVLCPFCKSVVEPTLDVTGRKRCPACDNTGKIAAPPPAPSYPPAASEPWTQPAPPAWQPPQGNAPGATAALVLGIVSFVLSLLGIVTAILAIVFGSKAKRLIEQSGGALSGAGRAKAGRILGWVYLGIIPLIVLAVVFVLVTKLATVAAPIHYTDVQQVQPQRELLRAFSVPAGGAVVNYTYASSGGTDAQAAPVRSVSLENPQARAGSPEWAPSSGPDGSGSVTLVADTYSLRLDCFDVVTCTITYTIDIQPTAAASTATNAPPSTPSRSLTTTSVSPATSSTSSSTTGQATCSTTTTVAAAPSQLEAWQPPAGAVPATGVYLYIESQPGDVLGKGETFSATDQCATFQPRLDGAAFSLLAQVVRGYDAIVAHPANETRFQTKTYEAATSSSLDGAKGPGLLVYSRRDCETTGRFIVDEADYDSNGDLRSLTVRFSQHCSGISPGLVGKFHWGA